MSSELIVLDQPEEAGAPHRCAYSWNGQSEGGAVRSLLLEAERRAARLRAKYLLCIRELGETSIDGKSVVDHLRFDDGLSFWWMTLLAEKSVWKSPWIHDAIRLLALEEVILEEKPSSVRLVSANPLLNEIVGETCRRHEVAYQWERRARPPKPFAGFRAAWRAMPHPLRGLASLLTFTAARWPLRGSPRARVPEHGKSILICGFFVYMDRVKARRGLFASRYWDGLPDLMKNLGLHAQWLHHFKSGGEADAATAREWVRGFNERAGAAGAESHSFLEAYLSPRLLCRVLVGWLRLVAASWRLRRLPSEFRPTVTKAWLWPLLREDWASSLLGTEAISGLLWIALFDRALESLPRQARGLYPCENQEWERAFVHAWRKHGHGQIIAVHTSTARFWDLRDVREGSAGQAGPCRLPEPDLLVAIGRRSRDAFVAGGVAAGHVVECEALRYGHLDRLMQSKEPSLSNSGRRVLVMGEYLPSSTTKMLALLQGAAGRLKGFRFAIRPHANSPVDPAQFPGLELELASAALEKELAACDVVFVGNMGTSAVDAYVARRPLVVLLDESTLNMSPLRGVPAVRFAATAAELADSLLNAQPPSGDDARDLLHLDQRLPRWRLLLDVEATVSPAAET